MMLTSTSWNAKCTFLATIQCCKSVTEGGIMTIFHIWQPTFTVVCVCVCVRVHVCEWVRHPYFTVFSHNQLYWPSMWTHAVWLLCPTMNLPTNRHTAAVVHHRLADFADIELQVIVNEPCDVRLSICPLYSVKIVSNWRPHVSHWKLFTGIMHVSVLITSISHGPMLIILPVKFLHYIYIICIWTDINVNCNLTCAHRQTSTRL